MDAMARTKINISMDVEDIYGDSSLLDEQIMDLACFCEHNDIICDIYVTGSRLANKEELFIAISSFEGISLGYHGNAHSFVPVPLMDDPGSGTTKDMAFLEENLFESNQKAFLENIAGGISLFRTVSASPLFRCPAFCWSPAYLAFMRSHGMACSSLAILCKDVFSFMGLKMTPVVEKPLEAFAAFDDFVEEAARYNAVTAYLHPSRLIYDQFWDKSAERNMYADRDSRLLRIKNMLLSIRDQFELFSLTNIAGEDFEMERGQDHIILESLCRSWKWGRMPKNYKNDRHINDCNNKLHTFFQKTI